MLQFYGFNPVYYEYDDSWYYSTSEPCSNLYAAGHEGWNCDECLLKGLPVRRKNGLLTVPVHSIPPPYTSQQSPECTT
jgi:hypothetical protein